MTEKYTLTNEEIETSFRNTNFGSRDPRTLLVQGVLKEVAGYRSGHTLKTIMIELGLLTKNGNPSKKGKRFMVDALYDRKNSG